MSDTEIIEWLDSHRQYVLGFAPSGDWSIFNYSGATCYGKTIRECVEQAVIMHKEITK